jgi:plasmid stabilization system protein ParE
MREYELHPEAYVDLREIAQYIADDSPDAAKRVVTEIFGAITALVPFPQQGHHPTDRTSRPLRFIRVYDYLIADAPDEKPLWVVAVFQGHRGPRVMAAILRGREDKRGKLIERPVEKRKRAKGRDSLHQTAHNFLPSATGVDILDATSRYCYGVQTTSTGIPRVAASRISALKSSIICRQPSGA